MANNDLLPEEFVPESVRMFGNKYMRRWKRTRTSLTTYEMWRNLFLVAALSRFEWHGLPERIDTRYLELSLLGWGAGAFARHNSRAQGNGGWWFARMSEGGRRDVYDNPTRIYMIAPNGHTETHWAGAHVRTVSNQYVTRKVPVAPDAALVYDNQQRAPLLPFIDLQARRLAEMDNTIDQHVNALRVPYILTVSEEGRANAECMYRQIASGQPAIYATPELASVVNVSTLQGMGAGSYCGDRLLNDELKIVSQVYTMLGIDSNAAAEKKERVQTAETLANNEQFLIQRRSALAARKRACADLARIGLDGVTCTWSVHHVNETQLINADDQTDGSVSDGSAGGMSNDIDL